MNNLGGWLAVVWPAIGLAGQVVASPLYDSERRMISVVIPAKEDVAAVRILTRFLVEQRGLWRIWLPLLLVMSVLPVVSLSMPLVQKQLIDGVFTQRRMDLLPGTVMRYGVLWLLATAIGIVRMVLQGYLGERTVLTLRQRLLDHAGALSLAFWRREHTGRLVALFQNDVPSLAGLFNSVVIGGLAAFIGLVLGAILMIQLNAQLAIVAVLLPPVVVGLGAIATRPLRPMARRVQEKAAELVEQLQENMGGMREIAAFGREETQRQQFSITLHELLRLRMRLAYVAAAFQVGQSVFSLAAFLGIFGFGGYLVLQGRTTLGGLVAMQGLFEQTYSTARYLFAIIREVQTGLASADRVYAFLDEAPAVQERSGARHPNTIAGLVELEHVSFAYRPEQPILHDISFVVRPGELVALVGPSGAGKSTLMSLIARFYDPTAGRVLIDGTDVRDLTLAGLRQQIGIVFQDTFLFSGTIRENIAFGRVGARDDEIMAAAQAANAWEFIGQLPHGLDTRVGERGMQLSEGQKQRVAIARALLRDPRILILDEPTSALDARTEHLLQSALDNLMRGRTTFVIAHRLATVQRADQLLVVNEGRIVERGTHDELRCAGGLYRELHTLQFGVPSDAAGTMMSPALVR